MQELKNIEKEKAQKILERKNYLSQCEALNDKYQLEKEHNYLMQSKIFL